MNTKDQANAAHPNRVANNRLPLGFLELETPSPNEIHIYTDGACNVQTGKGGWGALLIRGDKHLALSGSADQTTNNQMELTAAIKALKVVQERHLDKTVTLFTDSRYVRSGITEWLTSWKAKNWKGSNRKPVKNVDLWQQLDSLNSGLKVTWKWVKGHSGNAGNEAADYLAVNGKSY